MAKIKTAENGTKKDVIVAQAAKLFREKGYASSSMRELAEKLGVEAPSLYNYIGSKSELLLQVCQQVANKFTSQLQEVTSLACPASEKLAILIRFHIKMMIENYDEVYISNHDWRYLNEPYLAKFLAQRKTYENKLITIIAEGINTGELKNMNPHVIVLTLLSAVRGLEFWQRHKKEIPAAELEETMVHHLLSGLIK
jgi:TetR/AcrR family transcriptional regulator, cholesterol catabolism regulator